MNQRLGILFKIARKQIIFTVIVLIVMSVLLITDLGYKPAGLSQPEIATRSTSLSLRTILHNPINAPLTIPEHFIAKLDPHNVGIYRVIPVIYGVLTLVLFFGIVRFWFSTTSAAISTFIFATSSWFLHIARLGTPDVLLFFPVALTACALWLKHTLKRNFLLILCTLVVAVALYIPGAVWFVVAGLLWQRFTIIDEYKHTKNITKILCLIILLALLSPLVWSVVSHSSLIWGILGLPSKWPSPISIVRNLYHIPEDLFFRTSFSPVYWLGNLPILDIFTDAMFVLGVYSFWVHRSLDRSTQLFGSILLGIILISFGGPVTVSLIVPFIYIIIGVGIVYLWEQWSKIFPRNPVARSFGMIVLGLSILISSNYQLQRYFIAWPDSPTTKTVFSVKPTNF